MMISKIRQATMETLGSRDFMLIAWLLKYLVEFSRDYQRTVGLTHERSSHLQLLCSPSNTMGQKKTQTFTKPRVDAAKSFIKDLDAQTIHGLASRSVITSHKGDKWRLDMQTRVSASSLPSS
jgi:hypothetical protein